MRRSVILPISTLVDRASFSLTRFHPPTPHTTHYTLHTQDHAATTTSAAAIVSSRTGTGNNSNSANPTVAAAIATDPLSYLIDFREHDVPYGVRASIDLDLRIGAWYKVSVLYVWCFVMCNC